MAPLYNQKRGSVHRAAWYFGIPVTIVATLFAVGGGSLTILSDGGGAKAAAAIGDFLANPLLLLTMIPIWIAGGYSWAWFVVRAVRDSDRKRAKTA